MDAIYYISTALMIPTFLGLIIGLVYFLIRPHHLQKSKHVNNPVSRKKIALVGITSLFVAFVGFGSVLAATESASVKQAREAAEAKAEQAAADAARKSQEETERQREEVLKKPVTKTETEKEVVKFKTTTREDGSLDKGRTRIDTEGMNGERTITYEVTYVEGEETSRRVITDEITKKPVNEVKVIGTYVYVAPPAPAYTPPAQTHQSNCNPNYSGCVPNASDVDCAGGSGNGPAYTSGPVRVIGADVYDLDRDGNGWGCE